MLECVMLIALAKMPAGKRCDFSRPKIKFLLHSTTLHPTTIKALPKYKHLQKNHFCFPLIGFPHKLNNVRTEK